MTDIGFEKSGNLGILSFDGLPAHYPGALKEVPMISLSQVEHEKMKKWLLRLAFGMAVSGIYGALGWIAVQWVSQF